MKLGLVGLPLLATLSACASAFAPQAPLLQADALTVSGRYALPKAGGSPLAGRLRVAEVTVAPAMSTQIKVDPELLRTTVRSAVEKSLTNYGWLGAGADLVPVSVEVAPLALKAEKTSTAATAVLRFRPTGPVPCLQRDARADFKALSPLRSGGGQRAFGWVAGITLAVLSGPAGAGGIGTWIAQNDQDAARRNTALNAKRDTAYGEAVAPSFDKTVEARFAGVNATQLAIADYVAHLGAACAAPEGLGSTP